MILRAQLLRVRRRDPGRTQPGQRGHDVGVEEVRPDHVRLEPAGDALERAHHPGEVARRRGEAEVVDLVERGLEPGAQSSGTHEDGESKTVLGAPRGRQRGEESFGAPDVRIRADDEYAQRSSLETSVGS
jgi:hypothetical protein